MLFRKYFLLILCSTYFSLSFAQKKVNVPTAANWNKQTNIYEVNLRQYSQSGSILDFAKHLPRLRKMGVDILWFMPVTPIGIEGRKMTPQELGSYYAVRNYTAFSEEFGSMKDFKSVVKKAKAMGFKVITDWVANHTSLDNHWVKSHPGFYAKDSTGKFISPFDWSDVYKLDYNNREMRDSMINAMRFWIRETGIDGFRCDVAEEVPADFWKECIVALKKQKNVFMLAEGNKPWLHEAGFDVTYSWDMMGATTNLYAGKLNLAQFDSSLNSSISQYPKSAARLYFTTNHDENSWNGTEFEKYGEAYKTMAVFTHTIYQSIPLIYSGQEEPNKRRLKFFVKDPIEWKNYAMAGFYKTLLQLRKSTPALAADASYRRLKSSNDNAVFSYLRQKNGKKVVVILNMSNTAQQFTIQDKSIAGTPYNVFLMQKEKIVKGHTFNIEPWGYIIYTY